MKKRKFLRLRENIFSNQEVRFLGVKANKKSLSNMVYWDLKEKNFQETSLLRWKSLLNLMFLGHQ